MNRLEWEAKITEVFIARIPLTAQLQPDEVRQRLAFILKEFGEISRLVLLPLKPHHTHRGAIAQFTWSNNAIDCIKYLHERDVSSNFNITTGRVNLTARQSNKDRANNSAQKPAQFNAAEKRQLLDAVNERVKVSKSLLPAVAQALGKSSQLDDSSDIYVLSELVRDVHLDPSHLAVTETTPPFDPATPIKLRAAPHELYALLDPVRRRAVDQILAEASLGDTSAPIECDELADQTNVAFGFGKRTIGFRPSDLK